MPRSNWSIYIEGIGETHNGSPDDANKHMLDCLKALEENKHNSILQARFSSSRGEENWMDGITRGMHEELYRNCDPHEELVRMGQQAQVNAPVKVKADATREQSSATVGVRKPEQKDERGKSSKRLYHSDSEGGV